MEKLTKIKELTIEAKVENLKAVQDFVTRELEAYGYPIKLQTRIAIVTEEIFVNIAHYAYGQDTGSTQSTWPAIVVGDVSIRVATGDEIIIEFEDSGRPYNPLENADPDITLGVEEREIGGLGIFIVKNIMDTVKYHYTGNKNVLRIKKKVS